MELPKHVSATPKPDKCIFNRMRVYNDGSFDLQLSLEYKGTEVLGHMEPGFSSTSVNIDHIKFGRRASDDLSTLFGGDIERTTEKEREFKARLIEEWMDHDDTVLDVTEYYVDDFTVTVRAATLYKKDEM